MIGSPEHLWTSMRAGRHTLTEPKLQSVNAELERVGSAYRDATRTGGIDFLFPNVAKMEVLGL